MEELIIEVNKQIDNFNILINSFYCDDSKIYLSESKLEQMKNEYEYIKQKSLEIKFSFISFKKFSMKRKLKKVVISFDKLRNDKNIINNKCLTILRNEMPTELKSVDSKDLDINQLNSILVDEKNTLVIAGAGTGKTTTITGKVKYLLLKEKVNPKEILLLTYTKNASLEMQSRVHKETGIDLDVFTFHKLGKDIITAIEGKVPNLTNLNLNEFIRNSIKDLIDNDDNYKTILTEYLFFNQYLGKTKFDFENIETYDEYIKINPLTTLKNETVKSYEELSIANFLTLNGIEYKYESKYIIETNDLEYGQYHPDFYLPQYDLWIEHFGINRNGEVPQFFSGRNGKTATETYNEGIKWKRKLHKENNTKLVETFSYENSEGVLLTNLKSKLEKNNVIFKNVDYKEILKQFIENNKSLMNGLNELFSTVINLLRLNRISEQSFITMEMSLKDEELKKLILPIFRNYEKILKDFNEIDFTDMLNKATDYVTNGTYINQYKYVIVDEFQDMTKATFCLLEALRNSKGYNLYAVGDDWQSIYRFAGSDVGYITNFRNHFGLVELFFIPNTYRFSQSIADLAGYFVMKNPNQIKKNINSALAHSDFDIGLISGYTKQPTLEFLEDKLNTLPSGAEVLFLSRYNHDIKFLNESFTTKYDSITQVMKVKYLKRNDLNIIFRSIHAAKGLEADYVFILNNKKGNYGFPSTIQDVSIINYFLSEKDDCLFSEERRLMYVALTRARKKVWLVAALNDKSVFVDELCSRYMHDFKEEQFKCPNCGGKLLLRTGTYGKFFGCSNYPKCKYIKNIKRNN